MRRLAAALAAAASVLLAPGARAQADSLPSAESVLEAYHRAAGGEARLAGIRDATYEWTVTAGERAVGEARSLRKRPGQLREEFANGLANVSSPRAVWSRGPGGAIRLAEGERAAGSRLQAALESSFLTGLAEQGITARVVGRDTADGEPAWRVEFSRPDGARRVYVFGARSGLPLRIDVDAARGIAVRYRDWRAVEGVMEPHRVEIGTASQGIVFTLKSARFDTGVADTEFDPPAAPPTAAPSP